jgi:hypothetical protein
MKCLGKRLSKEPSRRVRYDWGAPGTVIPVGDRPHSRGFGEGFAPATSVGELGTDPEQAPCWGFRMSASRLGTDSCRRVELVGLPLLFGDPGWGQTLDFEHGVRPC